MKTDFKLSDLDFIRICEECEELSWRIEELTRSLLCDFYPLYSPSAEKRLKKQLFEKNKIVNANGGIKRYNDLRGSV